jgi:hypothetical protein
MRYRNGFPANGIKRHCSTLLAPWGMKARKRERVRCSSLVDRPVYPRLRGTMQAATDGRNVTAAILYRGFGWALRRGAAG